MKLDLDYYLSQAIIQLERAAKKIIVEKHLDQMSKIAKIFSLIEEVEKLKGV